MKIFINIAFVTVIIYHLMRRKQNLFKASLPKSLIVVAALLLVIGLVTWVLKDQTILGFITVVNATLFFVSFFSAIGMNERHVSSFMSNSIVIQAVPWSKINNILLTKEQDCLYLKFRAYNHEFIQAYHSALEDELIRFINNYVESKSVMIEEQYYKFTAIYMLVYVTCDTSSIIIKNG